MRLTVEPQRATATPGVPTMVGVVVTNASDVIAGYVDRFSPGELTSVDAPHFMEVVAADEIVRELREVIALTDG